MKLNSEPGKETGGTALQIAPQDMTPPVVLPGQHWIPYRDGIRGLNRMICACLRACPSFTQLISPKTARRRSGTR
jgi:hypothetical protein